MLVKPADTSPHECASTYFQTGLRMFLNFEILDSAATKYQVKLKESMFIKWEKPDLNQQGKHINLTLTL